MSTASAGASRRGSRAGSRARTAGTRRCGCRAAASGPGRRVRRRAAPLRAPSAVGREKVTRDRAVRREELLLRRLGERLHALAGGEPAHAGGRGEAFPGARRRSHGDASRLVAHRSRRRRSGRSCAGARSGAVARALAVSQLDEANRRVERDADGAAGGNLEPAAAELGARRLHLEGLAARVADEPAGPAGPPHGQLDGQRLTGRESQARARACRREAAIGIACPLPFVTATVETWPA